MKRSGRAIWIAARIFAMLLLGGCGGDGLVRLSGQVTFDGKPIEQGTIQFLSADGAGPTAGALITAGRYVVRVAPGRKKVAIQGCRVVGKQHVAPGDLTSPIIPKTEPFIPEKYNTQTALSIDVQGSSADANYVLNR